MTNTKQTAINVPHRSSEEEPAVTGDLYSRTLTVHDHIRTLQIEAASERLAAIARGAGTRVTTRRRVGELLIRTGRRIAGEPGLAGSPAARPGRPMAA